MRNIFYFLFLLMAVFFFYGCKSDTPDQAKTDVKHEIQYLTIKGSDTMVHLVSAWAEAFMNANLDVEISVTGGGSGTGIAALINGTTDICAASRAINDREMELATTQNLIPAQFTVAIDGIAVVVHPENPVKELSLNQLRDIFTGRLQNWSEVGGVDGQVLVFSRESSSGTYVFFQEHAMDKQDYTPLARLLPGTSALVQAVASDRFNIGYVGLGYVEEAAGKVRALRIRGSEQLPAVVPSVATVLDNSYPLARPLYIYTSGTPRGTAKKFIDFCLSGQGQGIVRTSGYVPVKQVVSVHN